MKPLLRRLRCWHRTAAQLAFPAGLGEREGRRKDRGMLARCLLGMLALRCCRSRATSAFVFNVNSRQVLLPIRRGVSTVAAAGVEPPRRVLLTCRVTTSSSGGSHRALSPAGKRNVNNNVWSARGVGVGMLSTSALRGGRRGGGGRGGGRGRGGRRSPDYGPARAGQHR